MRFATVFVFAIAAVAPALASFSEFDARDDGWTSFAARSEQEISNSASTHGKWNPPPSNSHFWANRPNTPTNRRRWVEVLEERGSGLSKGVKEAMKSKEEKAKEAAAVAAANKKRIEKAAWTTKPKSYEEFKKWNPDRMNDPYRDPYYHPGTRRTAPQQGKR
ncbi:hypothetical protein C8Q72DRAFT_853837 [Fomitopsis betulina]|nr:hypothetical protein C8Q72DRAFT_853837 [Fomitopsis betulina]